MKVAAYNFKKFLKFCRRVTGILRPKSNMRGLMSWKALFFANFDYIVKISEKFSSNHMSMVDGLFEKRRFDTQTILMARSIWALLLRIS